LYFKREKFSFWLNILLRVSVTRLMNANSRNWPPCYHNNWSLI